VVGSSGGPLVNADGDAVAVHTGGGTGKDGRPFNEAAPINRGGNDFTAFLQIFKHMQPASGGHATQDIDVMMIGKAKNVGGFVFAWRAGGNI